MDYLDTPQTLAAAESRRELAQELLARAQLAVEGDVGWLYATKVRKLGRDAVRAALPELRVVEPLIPGRDPGDYALMSLLRNADGETVAFQLTFINCDGSASTRSPKRQTYNLVPDGVRDGLFRAGGGAAAAATGRSSARVISRSRSRSLRSRSDPPTAPAVARSSAPRRRPRARCC